METKSIAIGAVGTLLLGGMAFGLALTANADTQLTPTPTTDAVSVAPTQEPVQAVVTTAPEPSNVPAAAPVAPAPAPVQEPAPVAAEPAPVYVAPEPAPAPAPVAAEPAPAPAPVPAGEYNQVQLQPVNGTSATAYSTDPNAPVNAPTAMPGNGKRG